MTRNQSDQITPNKVATNKEPLNSRQVKQLPLQIVHNTSCFLQFTRGLFWE